MEICLVWTVLVIRFWKWLENHKLCPMKNLLRIERKILIVLVPLTNNHIAVTFVR